MKIFIIQDIFEIQIIKKELFDNFFLIFNLKFNLIDIGWICWYFWEIDKSTFEKILPIINGLFWKYLFYENLDFSNLEKNIYCTNIYNTNFDDDTFKENSLKIEQITNIIKSDKLKTNSLKKEIYDNIIKSIFDISCLLIKTYFLMYDAINNKNDLKLIISNKELKSDLTSQASLVDYLANDKLMLIKTRFDNNSLLLNSFWQILKKYYDNYVK